ncbi:tripartite tricarboxylate transporter substrate binding protein [Achromobacter aloeverae]|nr:tripartite tricarboxylate transporter substrate binding protein [Achromobacter aloeverae]
MPFAPTRRRLLRAALASAALPSLFASLFGANAARAATPTRLVVPLAPGGAMDLLARKLGEALGATLRTPFVIENRPGAGGNIAFEHVAKADPDGATLLLSGSALVANITLMPGAARYDPLTSFSPVGMVATSPLVIVVAGHSPIATWADLLQRAKTQGVTVGTPGFGNEPHVAILKIRQAQGGDWRAIPYKGAGPATVAAMAGETDAAAGALPGMLPHLASGKLRALAVIQARRSPLAPAIPSLAEAGTVIPFSPSWFGLLAPAGTPAPVVDRVGAALRALSGQDAFRGQLNALGFEPADSSEQAFARQLRSDGASLPKLLAALEHASAQ